MCCDPRYCPPAQHQPPTPTPSRPRGGGAGGEGGGATPSARSLPPSQPPSRPPTTSRINRSATPYKRCSEVHASQCSAPPTMISRVVRGCERGGRRRKGGMGGRGYRAEHDKYKTKTNKKEEKKPKIGTWCA